MNTAHHILIYGCKIPGYHERDTPRVVWDCGEMANSRAEYIRAPTCASGSQIVYAWAMDAPALALPEGLLTTKIVFKFTSKEINTIEKCFEF